MTELRLVIEEAGCDSCVERVRAALEPLVTVEAISIDEGSDTASVVAHAERPPSLDAIDAALAGASVGAGHTYRLRR